MIKKRARTDEAKTARGQLILSAAMDALEKYDDGLPSVASIAKRANLAKGTVYLYYQTKEEIFLEALSQGYRHWFEKMEQGLEKNAQVSAESLAILIVDTVTEPPTFLKLAGMSTTILELNLSPEKAYEFKMMLGESVDHFAEVLAKKLAINKENTIAICLESYAAILGAWQASQVPKAVTPIKERVAYQFLFQDFKTVALRLVQYVLQGHLLSQKENKQ